ncbi:kit ligand-like isoform X1 [Amblyraja radiata]|uniref:kit ligand-like isoform X1 n=1 Tax=Amblyraja radiata TaxID=386614 RepID=UPI0014038E4E|nr:kit ligand-like isoform X1 [Amblyraja radiata]
MKEANTLINIVIFLQFFLLNIIGGPICKTGNPVTDDIRRIDELVGNLPSDYKIQIRYISKVSNVTDTCWLHLTVPEMSFSLDALSEKFAKNSSNYLIIENLHRILHGIHNCLSEDGKDYVDESEFNCEKSDLVPKQYFTYFNEIISAFQSAGDSSPCDSEVVCRMEGPDTGRGSNSTSHTLEQTNKTCVPRCERTLPELGRLVRAKRHSLRAKELQNGLNRFKEGCPHCETVMGYLPTILIATACTVSAMLILVCLIVQLQKHQRRNSTSQSYQTDIESERQREENEQAVQFIAGNEDSCT